MFLLIMIRRRGRVNLTSIYLNYIIITMIVMHRFDYFIFFD